jgi:hypothetical protein
MFKTNNSPVTEVLDFNYDCAAVGVALIQTGLQPGAKREALTVSKRVSLLWLSKPLKRFQKN